MAKMLAGLVLLGSTATGLAAARLPTQWPGARSALVFAFAPTDDDAVTRPVNLVAPSKAARSPESGFLPAPSESNPHHADHVSASVAHPPRLQHRVHFV